MRITLLLLLSSSVIQAQDAFPTFRERVLDPEIGKVCYAVTLADVNGNGKPDVVAVTENRVLWYENPSWKRHVIIEDQAPLDHVCIDPYDIDGDGQIDFALGAGWTRTGTIHWLTRGASLEEPWKVHSIGEERWVHRMRWADVLGTGKPQLVVSPLNAVDAEGVRLLAFEIPDDPARDRWPMTVMNDRFNRMHNHWHVDFNGDGRMDTLTASREGIHLIRRRDDAWTATRLGTGAQADDPNLSGAGEIKTGHLPDGRMFITTIEPMHGTMLVVYLPPEQVGELWQRYVIDDGFQRGHALWTADVNGDGHDEIVFGHSDTPDAYGVNVYQCIDKAGTKWRKHVVDAGGMATEDLIVGDVTGDGRPDIIAGGRSTRNLKLYINTP